MPASAAIPCFLPARPSGVLLRHRLLASALVASMAATQAPVAHAWPARGGVGGPASGAGVRPGAGWGAPGVGFTRASAAAHGAAAYHPGWAGGGYWAASPWTSGGYGAAPLTW